MENDATVQHLHTTIKVTRSNSPKLVKYAKKFGNMISKFNSGGQCDEDGNEGKMFMFGLYRLNGYLKKFSNNEKVEKKKKVYAKFVKHLLTEIKDKFPIVLLVMTQSEYSHGITSK